MKNNNLQLSTFWKNSVSLILGLGLLLGSMTTQAVTDCNAVTEISEVECESLLELYHSVNSAKWNKWGNKGWDVTNTPCSWDGVTCKNGGVTEINLSTNRLTGTIPDLKSLPNLQKLNLWNNQLTGVIPDFSALPNLQSLDLVNNELTGTIPDFSALPKLQVLELSGNQLTGEIPNFSALPNLETLYIYRNQLTGTIPNFNALPKLVYFIFTDNQLTLMNTNCNTVTQISSIECESLLELYHSTNGANWKNNNGWNITNTPCAWYGITCENGGVIEIKFNLTPHSSDNSPISGNKGRGKNNLAFSSMVIINNY